MVFQTLTQAKAAFKKVFGKAHTSNLKELANEAIPSDFTISHESIFGQSISSTPATTVSEGIAADCTGANALSLSLDGSSNGKAYFAEVPSGVPGHPLLTVVNPLTSVNFVVGDRVTRTIPQKFGDDYRPVLKNSGTEVPPLSSEDWYFDEVAGIVTSEDNLSLGTGTLECFVYIGSMLSDVIGVSTSDGYGNKISANDTTDGYLSTKLVAGANITITEINDGYSETLSIASTGGGGGTVGTFAPVVKIGVTSQDLTYGVGSYSKTGNAATVAMSIKFTKTGSGLLTIEGLPFASDATVNLCQVLPAHIVGVDTDTTYGGPNYNAEQYGSDGTANRAEVQGKLEPSSTTFTLRKFNTNISVGDAELDPVVVINITGTYITS